MNNKIIEKIVNTAHHIYNKDMIIAKAGNISIILSHGYILISRQNCVWNRLANCLLKLRKEGDLSASSSHCLNVKNKHRSTGVTPHTCRKASQGN